MCFRGAARLFDGVVGEQWTQSCRVCCNLIGVLVWLSILNTSA